MKKAKIWTDGACSNNPGAGGWGAIVLLNRKKKEISGYKESTTNNEMELTAVIEALNLLSEPCIVELYTDSAYVVNAFLQDWVTKWAHNGYRNSDKRRIANLELWQRLIYLNSIHRIKWNKVQGHSNDQYNNRCDDLARGEIMKHIDDKPKDDEQQEGNQEGAEE